jgi:predicted ATPase
MAARAPKKPVGESRQTTSEAPPLLQELYLRNVLSFGWDALEVKFGPLNILIGPNGSGKSNLIEIISLLRSFPDDYQIIPRDGGGATEWIWKGAVGRGAFIGATISTKVKSQAIKHLIQFTANRHALDLFSENIVSEPVKPTEDNPDLYYTSEITSAHIDVRYPKKMDRIDAAENSSILKQLRDPKHYPKSTYLSSQYSTIRIYREWQFGRTTIFRSPQPTSMPTDRLEENFANLALFLNRLCLDPQNRRKIVDKLSDLYDGINDIRFSVVGNSIEIFLTEGNYAIPASRLSDGTLRYLCLLAILCDPTPPPLICIEEPEVGLHPDILHKIADLLVEASSRTQLIVTTHSDIIIDALTEHPEAILVCEKYDGQTTIQRLDADELKVWLEKYSLGALWLRGGIGGTRW